jgi:hypothetical protein
MIKAPHIVQLTILVIDPIGSLLHLLRSKRAKSLHLDTLLLLADKPKLDLLLERSSGMKKPPLKKLSQHMIFFFFP